MATKQMTLATGYHQCARCHASIKVGEFYHRDGPRFTHSAACSAPVAVRVAAPAPVLDLSTTGPRFYRCPRCGVRGRGGAYPFSTCPDVACDDCA